jgi:adenosylcobinamide-GDP ribazoletransferase
MHSFLTALALLTVLPVRFRTPPTSQTVARCRFWFPAVGLLIGAALGAWAWLTARFSTPPVAAFLVLLVWVGLTGALHLDGLCDLCDGLFGGHTPEDRLRIMKDPHVGTFGLAGGVLLLLGKYAALQAVVVAPDGPWLVCVAAEVARCLALVVAAGSVYPRAEGTGKAFIEAVRGWEGVLFAAAAAGVGVAVLWPAWRTAAVAVGLSTVVVLGLKSLCRCRLGGVTGDCLGAAVEVTELVFLTGATAAMNFFTAGRVTS